MEKLIKYLEEKNISAEDAINYIEKWLVYIEKRKQITKAYYLKNKEAIDSYHRTYRKNNPEYRKKRSEKAKEYHRKKQGIPVQ